MEEENDVVFEPSNEDGTELSGKDQVKALREKIKELEKEKTEYLDGWQRARADYANLQKTAEEDKKRFKSLFAEKFVEDLIPVIDSFSMAMANKEAWEKVDASWRTGVEYIYNQLMSALESHDLKSFGAIGETFDPNLHEAVNEEETENKKADHTIAKVIQKGFMIGETILRPARVTVFVMKK